MAKESIICGLDIGTCYIRAVVAKTRANQTPQIIGVGQAPSFGLRRGVVIDIDETSRCIGQAIREAEKSGGIPIERVSVSLSGNHIVAKPTKGVAAVSRADGEVSKEDVDRAIDAASVVSLEPNRQIFHVISRSFSIDNQEGIRDPVRMTGSRLEVDALVVEGASPFIKNLSKCVSDAGLELDEMVLAPLAASRSALSKRQKELGVLALDLGGGTAGMVVFEEGDLMHSCILPVGSSHITNDIAIGLRSDVDLAERVKLEYGTALLGDIGKKDVIDLSKLGLVEKEMIPRRMVAEIIEARVSEILDMTNRELKKIDRQGLLPAGVVLLGGGAKMPGIVDLAKETLKLPVQIGFPAEVEGVVGSVDDPTFATAIGLVLWTIDNKFKKNIHTNLPSSMEGTVDKMRKWVRSFLP